MLGAIVTEGSPERRGISNQVSGGSPDARLATLDLRRSKIPSRPCCNCSSRRPGAAPSSLLRQLLLLLLLLLRLPASPSSLRQTFASRVAPSPPVLPGHPPWSSPAVLSSLKSSR